jgi:hypothetical protein
MESIPKFVYRFNTNGPSASVCAVLTEHEAAYRNREFARWGSSVRWEKTSEPVSTREKLPC